MPGQIVIINGTSGSGKSTAAELFQKRADDYWLLYGIDHFLAGTQPAQYGHHGPKSHEGIYAEAADPALPNGPLRWRFGPKGVQAFATLHEWLAAASRQGCNIIFDHLLLTDPPVLEDCVRRLAGLPVLLVTLKPPFEVLESRVAKRAMDKKLPVDILGDDAVARIVDRLSRLRPWFYQSIYANTVSDIEIDTSQHDPISVCEMIEQRLAEGPGLAFDRLRRTQDPAAAA
ncbi:AAA family ATPase [Novosphingobium sp. 9U]|uniref:phosphotransferase-like protein n=1 Tax=Novosphingobium sp. 9U TaxID=2653158 RepID=UPI0012EF8B16|nr:AAA family ATPase [Novosphingobium sp. 9U]VWX54192.1 Chloramphenicol phosphotransferase [Novosphingobium sp. 9U]